MGRAPDASGSSSILKQPKQVWAVGFACVVAFMGIGLVDPILPAIASGGASAAIILYEAALGLGIAVGPLLGGLLGTLHWSGPFFGTSALMAIAFVAILVLFDKEDTEPRVPTRLSAPIRALANPVLIVLASAALFYNIGFFVLLAYTPFPLGMSAVGLGLVFFGWGVAVAVSSVWVAPLLTARVKRTTVLATVLPLLALDLVAAGVFVSSQPGLVLAVIIGGLLLGVLNTVFTESVMEGTDLPRSVASSAYSAVRFLGGATAPPLATLLAELFVPATPYYVGAASVLVATIIVIVGARRLADVNSRSIPPLVEAEAIGVGEGA